MRSEPQKCILDGLLELEPQGGSGFGGTWGQLGPATLFPTPHLQWCSLSPSPRLLVVCVHSGFLLSQTSFLQLR